MIVDCHQQRHSASRIQRACGRQLAAGDIGLDVAECARVDAFKVHDIGCAIGRVLNLVKEACQHAPHAERRVRPPSAPRLHSVYTHIEKLCGLRLREAADAERGFEGRHLSLTGEVRGAGITEIHDVQVSPAGTFAGLQVVPNQQRAETVVLAIMGLAPLFDKISNGVAGLCNLGLAAIGIVNVGILFVTANVVRGGRQAEVVDLGFGKHLRSPSPLAVGQSRRVDRWMIHFSCIVSTPHFWPVLQGHCSQNRTIFT